MSSDVGVRLSPRVPFMKELNMTDEDTSVKFRQINIPCATCLVTASCEDKDRTIQEIEKFPMFDFLLGLQKWDESKKVYRKGLIEAWANMGWDMFSNMRTTEFKDLPKEVSPEFLDLLIELAGLIQWIINSTSWRNGEKQDFDITEIKRKLEKAKGWI